MKHFYLLVAALLIVPGAHAQKIEKVQPSGKVGNAFLAVPVGVRREFAASARDLVTFRDQQWNVLTIAQIGAGVADAKTSLNNFHACPTCEEIGTSRYFVGARPDAHKYFVAGLIEIGVESVAGHYLRNHGPARKWYWRYVWTLPQSISLYQHAHAANHNAGLRLACSPPGARC